MNISELELDNYKADDLIEHKSEGCINTDYVLIKAAFVVLYVQKLQEQGMTPGVDYFILGTDKYRQIHMIKK